MALAGVALAVLVAGAGARTSGAATALSGWLMWGNDAARSGQATAALPTAGLRPLWLLRLRGRVTGQVLAVRGLPARDDTSLYVATSEGFVYAIGRSGHVRWRRDLGQASNPCRQLDGYGVTGTPVVDSESRTLYVAGPFGWVHALDLASGAERPGWPVRVYGDYDRSLVWGALTLVRGALYVPTASYCDEPMVGKLFRVSLDDRAVTSWTVVPPELGGGGGIWGWGGVAYSSSRDSLLVATGNAFAGGANVGPGFSEAAGYGEQVVELSLDLAVRGASRPEPFPPGIDVDLVGSPVVAEAPGCGEIVAALSKIGWLYGWRSDTVGGPPAFALELPRSRAGSSVISQIAWSRRAGALFVVTDEQLVRVDVDSACGARIAWTRHLGASTTSGSPTVAGTLVWLPVEGQGQSELVAVDAATGEVRYRSRLGGPAYTAPTVLDGRLYLGGFNGNLHAYGVSGKAGASPAPSAAALRAAAKTARSTHVSWSDAAHGWLSLPTGVYSTDDGGRRWRRIYPSSAARVLRTSTRAGVIATGADPGACNCELKVLLTRDGGRTWRATTRIGNRFDGMGSGLYWWREGSVYRVQGWPATLVQSKRVVTVPAGLVVDAARIPGGVAALVSRRVSGVGNDNEPQLILVRGDRTEPLTLPMRAGSDVLVRSVSASWPAMVVRATSYDAADAAAARRISWRSDDGGRTWTLR